MILTVEEQTKPIYRGVTEDTKHLTEKELWKRNCIPYVGYLRHKKNGIMVDVWREIFTRYVRMKDIAWPCECYQFGRLFLLRHFEFWTSPKIRDEIELYGYRGAYYTGMNSTKVETLFLGKKPLLYGNPVNPKQEQRDSIFLKLSLQQINKLIREMKK